MAPVPMFPKHSEFRLLETGGSRGDGPTFTTFATAFRVFSVTTIDASASQSDHSSLANQRWAMQSCFFCYGSGKVKIGRQVDVSARLYIRTILQPASILHTQDHCSTADYCTAHSLLSRKRYFHVATVNSMEANGTSGKEPQRFNSLSAT